MARSKFITTPLGIASYTKDMFTPRENKRGELSYGLTVLFDKTVDLGVLKQLAVDVAVEEWGDKAKQWIKEGLVKSPFLDGDGKQGLNKKTGERHAGYAGRTFIRCTSGGDKKPKVYDRRRNPVMDPGDFMSGSQCLAVVNAYTWENAENGKGITFGVSMVQVVKNASGDEVLGGGGGPSPADHFDVIEDTGDMAADKAGSAADMFG